MQTKLITLYDQNQEEYCVDAPARWDICTRCEGEGHHSNPAIDGNGITQSEWAEWDVEDRRNYLSGAYDIRCNECHGSGKLLVIDRESFKQHSAEDYNRWVAAEREASEHRAIADAEVRWERRMLYGSEY